MGFVLRQINEMVVKAVYLISKEKALKMIAVSISYWILLLCQDQSLL